ncbi:uncharacterized protein LODBEIA_P01330 [Lodderomyces beijingensis]|uniref:tRNA-splicing endonuclease subunit Sen34 n=1 Tax=Lodderomyces beijingensis TaxID=1775926 RepID=A0ABP0ZCJ0_9ASCO
MQDADPTIVQTKLDTQTTENASSSASTAQAPQKIILPVISPRHNPEVLLFNVEDIRTLRNDHHILGLLSGTLPQFPQQNIFLSIPLKLNIYETLWLVKMDVARLVDQLSYRLAKLQSCTQTNQVEPGENMVTIPNMDPTGYDHGIARTHEIPTRAYIESYLSNASRRDRRNFKRHFRYYAFLQDRGFYINPGLKFGGDLVLYPGDPLRYHSYSIVRFEFVDMYEIISGGRLATSVKKNMIVMGSRDANTREQGGAEDDVTVDDEYVSSLFEDEVPLCFSIEWSGFG